MRHAVLALTSLALLGCATAKETYLPDGRKGYAVSCDGSAGSWSYCYQKAGQLCGESGYDVFDKNGETGSIVTATTTNVFGGSTASRSMLIGCKTAQSVNR